MRRSYPRRTRPAPLRHRPTEIAVAVVVAIVVVVAVAVAAFVAAAIGLTVDPS